MNAKPAALSIRDRMMPVAALLLPVLAAGAVTWLIVVISPAAMPVWAFGVVGIALGIVAVTLSKIMDTQDVLVVASIILVLSLLLAAVSIKSKENAQRREMQRLQRVSLAHN